MEEKSNRSCCTFQSQNNQEHDLTKKIQILTCKLNESKHELTKLSHMTKGITEEKNKYKTYLEFISEKFKQITEGKVNCDTVSEHVSTGSCSKKSKLLNFSIEENMERYTENLMGLIDVCQYYEKMLETFEKIKNESQHLQFKQLNQEQELKKKDSNICEMKTNIINMQNKISVIEKDKNILEIEFEMINDELYNKKIEHESYKLKLENTICSMEKELQEFKKICNEKCDNFIVHKSKLENDLSIANDNKICNINNITKYVLNLKPLIKNVGEQIKKSDDENIQLKTKICFVEHNLNEVLNQFNMATSEVSRTHEELQNSKKEMQSTNKKVKSLESDIMNTDKIIQLHECKNNELVRKLELANCQIEMTKNELFTKQSEHDKLISENERLSLDNCTLCTIINNLNENVQELKKENECKICLTYNSIETSSCSIDGQPAETLTNIEYQQICSSKDCNTCDFYQRDCNNNSCIDQCNCDDNYLCSFQTKTISKCDCVSEREYFQTKIDNMERSLNEKEMAMKKKCLDIERTYYNMEKVMEKRVTKKKEQYENKIKEFDTQIEMYEKDYLLKDKELYTYRIQETKFKKIISDHKLYIISMEKKLNFEQNKVVSLIKNLNSYKNHIENVSKALTSEKCKNDDSENQLKTLTNILKVLVNKMENQGHHQNILESHESEVSKLKTNTISNDKTGQSTTSPTKRRKKKRTKNNLGTAATLAGNDSVKMTELPQLKYGQVLIENFNNGNIKSKSHKKNRKSGSDETPSPGRKPKIIKQLDDELNIALSATANVNDKNLVK